MILTLCWYGFAMVGPRAMGRASLRRGQLAMADKRFDRARYYFSRAARYRPLQEQAVELLAEASILGGKPAEAIYEINAMLLERQGAANPAAPRRVRLLRAIAGCMIGRANAARRELAQVPRETASVDELLAAAQACIMANDLAGARQLCELLEAAQCMGAIGARVRLCRSAIWFRQGAWAESLEALPAEGECAALDRVVCHRVRGQCEQKLRGAGGGRRASAS